MPLKKRTVAILVAVLVLVGGLGVYALFRSPGKTSTVAELTKHQAEVYVNVASVRRDSDPKVHPGKGSIDPDAIASPREDPYYTVAIFAPNIEDGDGVNWVIDLSCDRLEAVQFAAAPPAHWTPAPIYYDFGPEKSC